MRAIQFTSREKAWLRKNCTKSLRDYHADFCAVFRRTDVSASYLKDLRQRECWRTGRDGRFPERPLGYEFLQNGFVLIKVDKPHSRTGARHSWVDKHRWLWEQTNGPIPKGMFLKCKGDRLNCDPLNWELIDGGTLKRLNDRNYDSAPDDVKPLIMAVAKLSRQLARAAAGNLMRRDGKAIATKAATARSVSQLASRTIAAAATGHSPAQPETE